MAQLVPIPLEVRSLPNQVEGLHDGGDGHPGPEEKDTGDMAASRKVRGKMAWHGLSLPGQKEIPVLLNPYQEVRVRCPRRGGVRIANGDDFDGRIEPPETPLDRAVDMFIEEEPRLAHYAGMAGRVPTDGSLPSSRTPIRRRSSRPNSRDAASSRCQAASPSSRHRCR